MASTSVGFAGGIQRQSDSPASRIRRRLPGRWLERDSEQSAGRLRRDFALLASTSVGFAARSCSTGFRALGFNVSRIRRLLLQRQSDSPATAPTSVGFAARSCSTGFRALGFNVSRIRRLLLQRQSDSPASAPASSDSPASEPGAGLAIPSDTSGRPSHWASTSIGALARRLSCIESPAVRPLSLSRSSHLERRSILHITHA